MQRQFLSAYQKCIRPVRPRIPSKNDICDLFSISFSFKEGIKLRHGHFCPCRFYSFWLLTSYAKASTLLVRPFGFIFCSDSPVTCGFDLVAAEAEHKVQLELPAFPFGFKVGLLACKIVTGPELQCIKNITYCCLNCCPALE